MNKHRPSGRRPGLAVYASLVALSAYAGAVGLATGALDLGATLNRRLPLHSPVFGAIALGIFVGVGISFAGIGLRVRDRDASVNVGGRT